MTVNPASDSEVRNSRMRYLSPTFWTIGAVGTFYLSFAAYDVYGDAKAVKGRRKWSNVNVPLTWDDVEATRRTSILREVFARDAQAPPSLDDLKSPKALANYWNSLQSSEKLMWGAIGLNSGLWGLSNLSLRFATTLMHVPALSRNYTLLTSTFGHVGPLHLFVNMYALYNFAPPVAASYTFAGNGNHLAAFYLSAGVGASLGYHLASGWPTPRFRFTPGLGASGAVLALIAAFALEYPDHQIGIMFLPFTYIPAQQALLALTVLETYGLFVGFKLLPFAHAAHLAGMAIGSAYVYWNGKNRLWNPARKVAFKQMRAVGMI